MAVNLTGISLDLPSSDPNIDVGQSFTMRIGHTFSGHGGDATNQILFEYTSNGGTDWQLIGSQDQSSNIGLSSGAGSPSQVWTSTVAFFQITVDGDIAGTYQVRGRSTGTDGPFTTSSQTVTVNQVAQTYNGTLDGTLQGIEGSLTGSRVQPTYNGTLDGVLQGIEGSLTGTRVSPLRDGTLDGVLQAIEGSLTGTRVQPTYDGTLDGVLQGIEGSLVGSRVQPTYDGTLDGVLQSIEGSLTGAHTPATVNRDGTLIGTLQSIEGSLTGSRVQPTHDGTLIGTLQAIEGSFVGSADIRGVFFNTSQSEVGWVRQPWTSWADTLIEFTVNRDGLPTSTDLEVAVKTQDGTVYWSPVTVQIQGMSIVFGAFGA